jgi:hypothetical protein
LKSRSHFFLVAAVLAAAGIAMLTPLPSSQAADAERPAATYSPGSLHLAIPYHAAHVGSGQLTVEVLDPEDQVLARSERRVEVAGDSLWQEDLKLAKPLAIEDLAWHRVRYGFTYAGEKEAALHGAEPISQILRMPVVHILGQQSYMAGGQAAVRVIVTDSRNEAITGPSSLRIELAQPNRKPSILFGGQFNGRGTTAAQFRFPGGLAGSFSLRYVVDTPIGVAELTQQVRLEDKAAILLTTEKPIYQPGQTIHVRALALERADHAASANRKLTFEVEDSRGNKVFKSATTTDRFGVASAEFGLADEVNLGTYHLRALIDGSPKPAEIALNVERYVLPKFKVALEFTGKNDGKNQQTTHGYRPGDHVTGTVRANYFFGKPLDGAGISVKASGMDVAQFDVAQANAAGVHGKTDADGSWRFDLTLPNYFAGRPLSQGAARVLIEATVKDAAGHSETRGEGITVSESPLIVTAVPEGGNVIPNLENQIFVLTSYADGKPASADITVHAAGNADQHVTTDAGGVAIVRLQASAGAENLKIEAADKEGNRASNTVKLRPRDGSDQILLRTERAVYRAGDRIPLHVFSTTKRGTAYVDIVKEGQTVLTRDLDIVNGQAELTLTATPDLAGTLDCNAYLFGRDARPAGDHRLVFVQPADELKIEATSDAPVYKPGDDARIHFRVTNTRGEGVQAALGLQVVDEAVFALAEKQPGFAKVFFYLEQEALKPRYEIHSIGMPDIVEPVALAQAAQRDRAARALFAATEMVNTNKFETEFGRSVPQAKYGEYYARYQKRFQAQLGQLATRLSRAYTQNPEGGDLTKVWTKLVDSGVPEVRDAWGTPFRVQHVNWNPAYYSVSSEGSNGRQFGMTAYLELRTGKAVDPRAPRTSGIELSMEHDRGPFNGLAEIAGSVLDPMGVMVAGAVITVREAATGKVRQASADAAGLFGISAVPEGDYEVRIAAPGLHTAARRVTLKVRDRAVLSATLAGGDVGESVVVANVGFGGGVFRAGGGGGGDGRVFAMGVQTSVVGGVVGGVPGGAFNRMEQFAALAGPPPAVFKAGLAMARDSITFAGNITPANITAPAAPHVRSYFPEALYINPEIVTDRDGRASIAIPMADSITTWRMAMLASTTHGALGSGTGSIKVFQDFFTDLDMPVTLTQGDRVSIPVAVYNYAAARGNVSLHLQSDDWFTLVEDVPDKTLAVDAGRVGGSQYTIEARRIGKFKLTLSARMTGPANRADIVVREIEVIPNGREQTQVFNGRLETAVNHELKFPAGTIPESSKIFVRLYPGPLSQVIEGMDAILRMPGGCFEQTSSTTYPNVLALDYMKRTKKLTPEVHAKAEGFIANGYQRLLTFEVPGGGFSWFGQAPANKILTAYGLMEFFDMSQVHEVDSKVIQRTQQWLAAQQQPDGSWKPDANFINEGATNRYNSDALRITAYIAWSLENTGYRGAAVEKAKQFVEQHMNGDAKPDASNKPGASTKPDAYTLAVLANFAADYGKDRAFTRQATQLLLEARTEKDEQVWWTSQETGVYATGEAAAVETTGLAVQALLKSGEAAATAGKALTYIASKKNASGAWAGTQATVMALRAVLLSTEKGAADVRGTVEITLNGKPAGTLTLTADNNDLLHQFTLKDTAAAANTVELRFAGKGGLAYQVVGRYFVPWDQKPAHEALSIDVTYDRTRLSQDDIATATATVKNNLATRANMVMVDLGIPPGFDLHSEDLQTFQEQTAASKGGRLEKFSLTATQAILYFDSIAPGGTVKIGFRLRAKYPIRARTFQSRVYEYYDPDVNSTARPVQLEVRKR